MARKKNTKINLYVFLQAVNWGHQFEVLVMLCSVLRIALIWGN